MSALCGTVSTWVLLNMTYPISGARMLGKGIHWLPDLATS